MSVPKDGWSADPARREIAVLRERLDAFRFVALGGAGVALLSMAIAGVALAKTGGKQGRIDATRIEADEVHCRSLRVSDKSIDPSNSLVMMPSLGGPALFNNKTMVWNIEFTTAGAAQNFYDAKGNLRMTLGCAGTKNKTTGDETLSSPGSVVIFKENGDVIQRLPY